MQINQAVILAGGQGSRLKPFTNKNPKPMVLVNGEPFLEHLINLLKENNIKEIIILTGYFGEKIEKYFGNGSRFGINIKYSYTPFLDEKGNENKSGLRLKNAEKLLDNFFLLLYCDNFWPLQIKKLLNHFISHPSDVLTTIYSNIDHSTKNNIFVSNGFVTKYDKSREDKNLNGVDIGFFIVNKKVLKLLPKSNSQFETEVLPKLIQKRRFSGYLTDQKYYSISDAERVKITAKFLSPKKIVFLDRDGVINKKPPQADYVKSWEEFEFLPKTIEAIRLLNSRGYKIIIITNQSGITRKKLSKKGLENIHKKMQQELKNNGAKIDKIYYCPHGWDEGCFCRKPNPGLLLQASRKNFIDLTKSIFIGDDIRDMEAGEKVGCKTILVNTKKTLYQIASHLE